MRRSSMRLRLLWGAIRFRPAKFLSVLGALIVGATLASAFLSLFLDLPGKMTQEFRTLGPNLIVSPLSEESTFPEEIDAGIAAEFPDLSRLPWLYAIGKAGTSQVILGGTAAPFVPAVHPTWQIETGGTPASWTELLPAGPAFPEPAPWLIAGGKAAEHFGWKTGESVRVEYAGRAMTFVVRGTLRTGRSEDSQLIVPLAALQSLTGKRDQLSLIQIAATGDSSRIEAIHQKLAGALPAADVRPLRPVVESEATVVMKVRNLMMGLTGIVLALVLLSVMTTISGMVLDSSSEIGVMKALGAREGTITRQLMTETTLLALAAALIGHGVGFVLARMAAVRIFGSALDLRADVLGAVVGITLSVALLATLLPARWIRRLDPAVILRGE